MRTTLQSQRGMALLMALSAIVVIGVLIGGVVFVSSQDYRIGGNTVRQARATAAAELGLNRVPVDWNLADNKRLNVGDTVQKLYTAPRGGTATVVITRLPGAFFWAVSEGKAGALGSQASARRRYGMLFRLNTPDIPFAGALTGRGNILVGGSATVNGHDSIPGGWSGCPAKKDVAGIVMSDTTAGIKLPGCNASKACVDGSPKFIQTAAAADTATYFVYGNTTYQELAATATVVVPAGQTLSNVFPAAAGSTCATWVPSNWGDPRRGSPAGACESYFPIIHALGDLHISTGIGQGILLVDGDLDMTGNFQFMGAVIVRGTLSTYGSGAHVTGAVMAANVDLDQNTVLGNSSIRYSSCALDAVMKGSAYPKAVKQRAWVDVY
jgi:hypothetical protein